MTPAATKEQPPPCPIKEPFPPHLFLPDSSPPSRSPRTPSPSRSTRPPTPSSRRSVRRSARPEPADIRSWWACGGGGWASCPPRSGSFLARQSRIREDSCGPWVRLVLRATKLVLGRRPATNSGRGLCAEPLPDQVMMQHAPAGPTQESDSPSQKCVTMRHHRSWGPCRIPSVLRVGLRSITTWNSSGFLRLSGRFGFPIDIALLRESGSRDWLRFAKKL
jgi:hypothetical protein